jgi:hypothetical protein
MEINNQTTSLSTRENYLACTHKNNTNFYEKEEGCIEIKNCCLLHDLDCLTMEDGAARLSRNLSN